MILDLEKLPSDERISGDEVVLFRDIAGEENRIHCHVELDVRGQGDTFYIHADLSGEFSTPCHKCLESTQYKVSPSFELVVRKVNPRSEPEAISADDSFVRLPAGQSRLEIDQYIYECLLVDIPIRITCRDDCRGLCSGCGVNLNREKCRCSVAPDPRWNELRKLEESE
jgi:uncharacterized protein